MGTVQDGEVKDQRISLRFTLGPALRQREALLRSRGNGRLPSDDGGASAASARTSSARGAESSATVTTKTSADDARNILFVIALAASSGGSLSASSSWSCGIGPSQTASPPEALEGHPGALRRCSALGRERLPRAAAGRGRGRSGQLTAVADFSERRCSCGTPSEPRRPTEAHRWCDAGTAAGCGAQRP